MNLAVAIALRSNFQVRIAGVAPRDSQATLNLGRGFPRQQSSLTAPS